MRISKNILASLTEEEGENGYVVPSFDFMDVHLDGTPYQITKDNVDDVFFDEIHVKGYGELDGVEYSDEFEWLYEWWRNLCPKDWLPQDEYRLEVSHKTNAVTPCKGHNTVYDSVFDACEFINREYYSNEWVHHDIRDKEPIEKHTCAFEFVIKPIKDKETEKETGLDYKKMYLNLLEA